VNFDDIPDDEAVFVDANILIYAAQEKSGQCRRLLQRIAGQTVRGVCSAIVVAELCHRSMLNEARAKQLISGSNPAKALSQRRDLISQLSEYAEIVRDILNSELAVEPLQPDDLMLALELQRQHGLLTNDSMHLAVARRLGVHGIATADSSFENVPGIIVYKPTDLVT
jgi:predicted nucleic acid-binding protein